MAPEEFRYILRLNPFTPFRLVMTDGASFEIRHPDLLGIRQRSSMVGLTGQPGQTFYERARRIDLLQVNRVEPLEALPSARHNEPT